MIAGVADTHTALWHLFGDPKLSRVAADFIQNAANRRLKVALSVITLAEVVYLVEKHRLPGAAYEELERAIADPEHVFTEAALTVGIVQAMRQVPRAEIPDMPDRLVAATAVYFSVPVISRDGRIRAASGSNRLVSKGSPVFCLSSDSCPVAPFRVSWLWREEQHRQEIPSRRLPHMSRISTRAPQNTATIT